ncbi:hypothetical protein MYX64_06345 [Nitrospinae bacterium AH_259_B05_G02_I21]|nr:hypothetical protein [Nitrospinae bacterium AH_259_B05_G02_I21]
MASGFDVTIKIGGREDVSRASVKAERSLTRLGTRGSRALKKIGSVGARVRRSMQALGRAIFSIRGAVGALLVALGARALISNIIDVTNEQAQAETRLALALATVAENAPGALERLKAYAGELQKTTGIGDEATISMMALIGTFQVSEKSIRALTPAILDFATAQGIDLNTAALLVGKAMSGQIATLSRYGIVLTKTQSEIITTGTEAQKAAAIVELLSARFGGQAEAAEKARLGTGRFKSTLGDILEVIGFQFMPTLRPLIALATEYAEQIQRWVETHNVAAPVLRGMVSVLGFLVQAINIVGKAWLTSRAVVTKTVEIYRRGLAFILGAVQGVASVGQRLGIVSEETVRSIALARTAQLEMVVESAEALVQIAEQFEAWDRGIKKVQGALGEFRAAIVPQFERVGSAAARTSAAIRDIEAAAPSIDRTTAEVIRLTPALDDAGRAAGDFADKQKVLKGFVDETTDALVRNAAAARESAAAAAAFGRGPIADLLGLLRLPASDPRRQAAGGGFRILSRLRDLGFSGGVSFAQHGAVLTGPTALIGGEAGRELVVPARRDQRSPEVQAELDRLMAAEGMGVITIVVPVNLDGRVIAKIVAYHNRRAA